MSFFFGRRHSVSGAPAEDDGVPRNPNLRLRRRASVPNAPSQTRGTHDRNVFQDLFRRHRDDSESEMSTVERDHGSVSFPSRLYSTQIVSFRIWSGSDRRNRLMQTNLSNQRQQLPKVIRVPRAPRMRMNRLRRDTTKRVFIMLRRHLNMRSAKKKSRLFSQEPHSSSLKGASMTIITHR